MMDYKQVLKGKTQEIANIRQAIATNRVILKGLPEILAGLKSAIRKANKDGDGATVSRLTKDLNLRRSLVRQIHDAQVQNRQLLRETYVLRGALIAEWVAKES